MNLASKGFSVFAIDKDLDGLQSLQSAYPDVITIKQLDLLDVDEKVASELALEIPVQPGVRVLVHNAAHTPATPMGKITKQLTQEMFAINTIAPMLLTQVVKPFWFLRVLKFIIQPKSMADHHITPTLWIGSESRLRHEAKVTHENGSSFN